MDSTQKPDFSRYQRVSLDDLREECHLRRMLMDEAIPLLPCCEDAKLFIERVDGGKTWVHRLIEECERRNMILALWCLRWFT